ncbi:hypothetical protein Ae201684P_007919 [Aphanomyces euteiches]|uniref:C3H1-type domain-containing protein n=1 Tax=Aphanomyces euteiches TaxID=100861 RepID=A0A6G0WM24_9STRA|nr:hypothetical protein Ae201684_013726 [Aphanomyces euteiches]KAH9080833.1 hypothetical protein Ae201684P_007919 [Aphanomyces euteiches]
MSGWKGEEEVGEALKSLATAKGISATRIKNACTVLMKWSKEYKRVVHAVEHVLWKADAEHRLAYLYLIDALIRASQAKYGEDKDTFGKRFGIHLNHTLAACRKVPDDAKGNVKRVVAEWIKRNVYTTQDIEKAGAMDFLGDGPLNSVETNKERIASLLDNLKDNMQIFKQQKQEEPTDSRPPHDRSRRDEYSSRNSPPRHQQSYDRNQPSGSLLPTPAGPGGSQYRSPTSRMDAGPRSRFDAPPPRYDGPSPRYDGPSSRFDRPSSRFDDPPSQFDRPPSRFDGPPSRFDGPPPSRFDGPPPSRFDGPPPSRFDGPPTSRFDGPPPSRFDGPPPSRFDGPPPSRFDGPPPSRFDGPPPSRFDGPPPSRFDGPPSRFDGPPNSYASRAMSPTGSKESFKRGRSRSRSRSPKRSRGLCHDFEQGRCSRGNNCRFSHDGDVSNSRPPPSKAQSAPKTRMCNTYPAVQNCRFGDRCSFAHSERELASQDKFNHAMNNNNIPPPTTHYPVPPPTQQQQQSLSNHSEPPPPLATTATSSAPQQTPPVRQRRSRWEDKKPASQAPVETPEAPKEDDDAAEAAAPEFTLEYDDEN